MKFVVVLITAVSQARNAEPPAFNIRAAASHASLHSFLYFVRRLML